MSNKKRGYPGKVKIPAGGPMIWGLHAVYEAWRNPARQVEALYGTEQALRQFERAAPVKRPPPFVASKKELDKMTGGAVHQGLVLQAAPLEECFLQDIMIAAQGRAGAEGGRALIVMLDQVTDPHNVGAILRSACAFGAAGLVMQRRHAPAVTGVLAKTACGAAEHVPVAYEINLSDALDKLKENGFFAIGLDERGTQTIDAAEGADKTVIVLGAEGKGLRPKVAEHCDLLVRLPTQAPIASLNVSNAAAVALYALQRPK